MKIEYDEISPITGNMCVVVEADPKENRTSYLCMESGYTTTDQLIKDSSYVDSHEENLTELMIAAKHEDGIQLLCKCQAECYTQKEQLKH